MRQSCLRLWLLVRARVSGRRVPADRHGRRPAASGRRSAADGVVSPPLRRGGAEGDRCGDGPMRPIFSLWWFVGHGGVGCELGLWLVGPGVLC